MLARGSARRLRFNIELTVAGFDSCGGATDKPVNGLSAPSFVKLLGMTKLRNGSGVIVKGNNGMNAFMLALRVGWEALLENRLT